MNARGKREPDDKEESARFMELADRLVSSGDLDPADNQFQKAIDAIVPKRSKRRKGALKPSSRKTKP